MRTGNRRLLVLYAPALAVLGAITVLHVAGLGNANVLLRDPLAVAGAPFYYGAVSVLGGLLWAGAAASCALGALVLSRTSGWTSTVRFLLGGALFNAALGLDDVLMIHDGAAPSVGIHELVVYAVIGVPMLAWAVTYRPHFRVPGETALLASALALLISSTAMDVLDLPTSLLIVEDVLKYLGLTGWSLYWLRSVATTLVTRLGAAPAQQAPGASSNAHPEHDARQPAG